MCTSVLNGEKQASHLKDTQRDKTDPVSNWVASCVAVPSRPYLTPLVNICLCSPGLPGVNMVVSGIPLQCKWVFHSVEYFSVKCVFSLSAAIRKPKQFLQAFKWGKLWFVTHTFTFLLYMMDGRIYYSSEKQSICHTICLRQAVLATAEE